MINFNFWQKWLLAVGVFLAIMGFTLAFFNQSQFMALAVNDPIDRVFWAAESVPENAIQSQSWMTGVLGATVSGWGITIAFLATYPFKKREAWVWICLVISMIVWYIADTGLSAYYNVTFNVILNTVLLILVGLPLVV